MTARVTVYWRVQILKAWGTPRLVAQAAYSSFLPFAACRWRDEEEERVDFLDDRYPSSERALDIGVMAGEMKDQDPEAFIAKLNEKFAEVFAEAIYIDDDGEEYK